MAGEARNEEHITLLLTEAGVPLRPRQLSTNRALMQHFIDLAHRQMRIVDLDQTPGRQGHPAADQRHDVQAAHEVISDGTLGTQPYYVYRYYVNAIKELVDDTNFKISRKKIIELGKKLWPTYSQKLNVFERAARDYVRPTLLPIQNQRNKTGDIESQEYWRKHREAKTGRIDYTNYVAESRINHENIDFEPFYIYKYFMNIVRDEIRKSSVERSKEEIRKLGASIWPTYPYQELLSQEAGRNYMREQRLGAEKSRGASQQGTSVDAP